MFRQGERVDMRTLAERLQVGRATLYRWVVDREKLIDFILARRSAELWARALDEAEDGTGLEHVLSAVRRLFVLAASDEPLVAFATREPNLALRVLLDPEGRLATALCQGLKAQFEVDVPEAAVPDDVFAALSLTATAMVWANVAGGRDPEGEATVSILRTVLATYPAAR